LFEDWHLDPMPLYVAFPPSRHVSRKLRVFIDWIVELLAQHAPAIQPRSPWLPPQTPSLKV
jgi:DNA-binding transcriptional LysR family regulator